MARACDVCQKPYEAKRPNSKFCSDTCRQRAARNPSSVVIAPVIDLPLDVPKAGALVASITTALADADRLESFRGQQALALARRIESPHETGAAVSSLSKELRAVMEEALKGALAVADPVDELRRKREQKLGAG